MRKPRAIDLTGQTFGRLTVECRAPSGERRNRRAMWECSCACGGMVVVGSDALRSGHTSSCGCLVSETTRAVHTKHGNASGRSVTPEYQAWINMRARCSGGQPLVWKNYGGRGIEVCAEWEADFGAFLAHVGRRPAAGYELDRIDNDKGYQPGNVRWVTKSENNRNRRTLAQVREDDRAPR